MRALGFELRRFCAGLVAICALGLALALPAAAQDAAPVPSPEAVAEVAARAERAIRVGGVAPDILESLRAEMAAMRDALADATARGDVAVRALGAELAELPPPPGKDETEPARLAAERARLAEALAEADAPLLTLRRALARLRVLIGDLDAQIRAAQRAAALAPGPSALAPAAWWKGLPEIAALIERRLAERAQAAALPGRAEAMRAGLVFGLITVPAVLGLWILVGRGLGALEAREITGDGRLRRGRMILALSLRAVVPLVLSAVAWPG